MKAVVNEVEQLSLTAQKLNPAYNIFINETLPRFYRNNNESHKFDLKRMRFNSELSVLCENLSVKLICHQNLSQVHFGVKLGVSQYVKNIKEVVNPFIYPDPNISHLPTQQSGIIPREPKSQTHSRYNPNSNVNHLPVQQTGTIPYRPDFQTDGSFTKIEMLIMYQYSNLEPSNIQNFKPMACISKIVMLT